MKVIISPAAEKDIIRQFRYYLVDQDAPPVVLRYRQAVNVPGCIQLRVNT